MALVTAEQAKEIAENQSSGIFVKLEDDGDKMVCVLRMQKDGADYIDCKENFWNETTRKNEPYTKIHKAEGKRANARFTINAFVISEGNGDTLKQVNAAKLFSMNPKTLQTVFKIRDKYGLDKWVFEVERKGKKDTKSDYQMLPETEISKVPGLTELLAKTPYLGFEADDASAVSPANGASAKTSNNDPIRSDLLDRLKKLPRENVNKFMTKFGVSKIKDVKDSDIEAAKAFVNELEGNTKAPEASAEVNDPFAD